MSEARKAMNSTDEIIVTDKDKDEARKLLDSLTSRSKEDIVTQYQDELDRFCKEFHASSYLDLMSRADMSEFSPEISSKILFYYSFLTNEIKQ